MPALSIITINYNNLSGLKQTVASVLSQSFHDYEYIIIDGGSTDGSTEFIKNNHQDLDNWVSEKDEGIFDAMNKGISKAKGEYILFLNSGDYLANTSVLKQVPFNGTDIIYGDVKWEPTSYSGNYPDDLTFEFFMNNALPHQASFIKRDLFTQVGLYDDSQTMNSDWTFFLLAIYKFNCSYLHLPIPVSHCNTEGISLKPGSWEQIVEMRKKVVLKHFAAFAKELDAVQELKNELNLLKRTKGYRLHLGLRKILGKKVLSKNKKK